jgi:hypothetical protein
VTQRFGRGPLAVLLGIQVWLLIGSLIALFDMRFWPSRVMAVAIIALLAWRVWHNGRLLFRPGPRESGSGPVDADEGDRSVR